MKKFNVPLIYRSPLISAIKQKRREADKLKKDYSPTLLNFGPIQVYLARHFGFCYGVENAIDIAFKTVEENPGKRIFLLSEMIHNPLVNADLMERGVQFLQDTYGKQLVPFESLTKEDVVIIPAFGTTLDIEERLNHIGIQTEKYNTTCPFVEKVWNRSGQIAAKGFTVIIHGKPSHEETRATFSHAASTAPAVVINDMNEAVELGKFITGEKDSADFYNIFSGRYSDGFDAAKDLQRIGVVNQTTMLASDTQAIADYLKAVILTNGNAAKPQEQRFADTRDTLCYATNDNQTAVYGLLETEAHFAIVVGGYNSSNTSHLVELCEEKLPTYFINSAEKIIDRDTICHFNFHKKEEQLTSNFMPNAEPVKILMTSGASCPDALVEGVIEKLVSFFPAATFETAAEDFLHL
ncbi:MAG TPA: 4-hydroxy-3-methylbut-2-enyl diphosphate reductase [Ferruginibacter sp.]|nr:4-hydroxy-3-methylbut-2-enyl diphosphate reductase [Ferruginibacter sp.]HMP21688.1 4-hydroxy-3-methylbut-2-enyl diphosphate reductase [Ferruginibacter sp.]